MNFAGPTPRRDERVDVNGIGTHFVEVGPPDGPALLFVHGAFSSTAGWADLLPHLSGKFRSVAFDLISHGYTDRVLDRQRVTVDFIVDHLERFVAALALREFVLVGNSLGCMIACVYAFREPASLRGMVLLDGGLGTTPIPVKALRGAPKLAAMPITKYLGDLVFPLVGKKMIRDWYDLCVHDPSIVTPERVERNARPLRDIPKSIKALNVLLRALFEVAEPTNYYALKVDEKLPKVDVPVLVAWGEHDRVLPRWIGEEMVALLPRARLEVLPDCGHLPQEEKPEATASLISRFVAEIGL